MTFVDEIDEHKDVLNQNPKLQEFVMRVSCNNY